MRIFLFVLLSTLCDLSTFAEDWPRYRGPSESGISSEKLAGKQLSIAWKAKVGIGNSCFVTKNGRAYTMGNDGNNTTTLFCFDEVSGREIWKKSFPSPSKKKDFGAGRTPFPGGPNSTPTIDGGSIYTVGRFGRVECRDLKTGDLRWSYDWAKNFPMPDKRIPSWGYAGSIKIHDDQLFLEPGAPGASVLCLNKSSGKLLWKAGDAAAAYSTPIVAKLDGTETLICINRFGPTGYELKSGEKLWEYEWDTNYGVNAASPVLCGDDRIFVSSDYGTGCAMIQIKANRVKELWRNKNLKNKHGVSVFHNGFLYGFDGSRLTCLRASDGETMWDTKGYGIGALALSADRMVVQSELPAMLLIGRFSPEGFAVEFKSEKQFAKGHSWTMPVISNGRIFTRNVNGEVVVFEAK